MNASERVAIIESMIKIIVSNKQKINGEDIFNPKTMNLVIQVLDKQLNECLNS